LSNEAAAKWRALVDGLSRHERVAVAFSGGVDSALLLAAAIEAVGADNVVALIGASATYPEREQVEAMTLARDLGVEARIVATDEMADPTFVGNPPDRCYHCKKHLFGELGRLAAAAGAVLVEGSNVDDRGDYRPGRRALAEHGVNSPLEAAGLTKQEIRELARRRNLPVWDKPALACLASRVPYGERLTRERLARIDAAEQELRALGFGQVRVRDHGEVARIEVEPDEIVRLGSPGVRERVVAALRAQGYAYVSVDLRGYRTGAMNETLNG